MTENNLIGWLCVIRWQFDREHFIHMPQSVIDGLVARGWMEFEAKPDFDGCHHSRITAAGDAVADINGPDFGIETLHECESE